MPDRRSRRAKEQALRLEARVTLGKAEKRWRENERPFSAKRP